jgi:hypothetical protein
MDVNVRDYGALGNDIHDDTAAFVNALNAIRATGGTCNVPAGTYKISGNGLTGGNVTPIITDNMHLVGTGSPVLHVHTPPQNAIIYCRGDAWSIANITMDMSNLDGPRPPLGYDKGIPILADIGNGWSITGCYIKNIGGWGMVCRGCSDFTIDRNQILCNNPSAHPIRGGILLNAYGIPEVATIQSYGTITNNHLDGCSIQGHARYTLFRNNTVINNGWGAGIGVLDIRYGNTDNVFIGNSCSFGKEGIDDTQAGRFFQTGGYEINSPNSLVFNNKAHDNKGAGIVVFGNRAVIAFNQSVDNGTSSLAVDSFASGLVLNAAPNIQNSSNSLVFHNVCRDNKPVATKTQDYGAWVRDNTIRCVCFIANDFHGNKISEGLYKSCQPNVDVWTGRDMVYRICSEKQREMLRSLFDPSVANITDQQYLALNQVLYESSNPRPLA